MNVMRPIVLRVFLDNNQKILKIVNNYEKISFNMGPTLMSWLEEHQSSVYKEIIEADKLSVKANNGHGNAIAQIYNHFDNATCQ